MTDSIQQLFANFADGSIDFGALQQQLNSQLQANPELKPSALSAIQEMYQAGRLPPQIYQVLMSEFGTPAGDRAVPPSADHESTVIGSPADANEQTRMRSPSEPLEEVHERTRMKPRSAPAEEIHEQTRVRPGEMAREPQHDVAGRDPTRSRLSARTDTFGSTGTGSNWANPEEWSVQNVGPLIPGDSVGRYYIESVLGEGGMGVVFKARDRLKEEAHDPDPFVAIKVLSEDFKKHPQSFVALAREWKKAASLSHDNIITVHNFDRVGTTVFMTMELLDGEPLDKLLKKYRDNGVPKERAARIIEGCARALAFAHSKGVVHSDFKPGNVFVTENDEIKVLDFGIARAVPTAIQPRADETVFDAAELGAMTPTYASTQMLEGKAPSPADDVYALAIVAYELFTGRHPFDRTPADEAKKRKLTAPTPAGPSVRQRRAIMQGLAFDDSRQKDAGVFYRQWRGLRLPKWVWGSLAASLVAAAFFAYQSFQDPGPEMPFNELSFDDQLAFQNAIDEGDEDLAIAPEISSAYQSAFQKFAEAYSIHPRNPEAEERLERTADGWFTSYAEKGGTAIAERDNREIVSSFFCDTHLQSYGPVVRACQKTFGATNCVWTETNCRQTLNSN